MRRRQRELLPQHQFCGRCPCQSGGLCSWPFQVSCHAGLLARYFSLTTCQVAFCQGERVPSAFSVLMNRPRKWGPSSGWKIPCAIITSAASVFRRYGYCDYGAATGNERSCDCRTVFRRAWLLAERIPETTLSKTPDFRILRGTQPVAFCEVKSPQDVFEESVVAAILRAPPEQYGGIIERGPVSRQYRCIERAAKKLLLNLIL